MSEGYASWIERATGTNPEPCKAPTTYPAGRNPTLGFWEFADPRATDDDLAMVAYQYDAACSIVSTVADQVGLDRMREILGVLATTQGAYEDVRDKGSDETVAWQDWLDAVDERGMGPAGLDDVSATGDLLITYGIATRAALDERVEARTALAGLRSTTDGWAVPLAVIGPMSAWRFDDARSAIDEAEAIIDSAEAVEAMLPTVDAETGPIHAAYEAADDTAGLVALHAQVDDQLETAEAVTGAMAAAATERGFVEQVGLMDTDLTAMSTAALAAVTALDTATARSQVDQLNVAIGQANDTGTKRIALVVGVTVLVVLLMALLVRMILRRRRRPVAAASAGDVTAMVALDAAADVGPSGSHAATAAADVDPEPSAVDAEPLPDPGL
jgi:hypothetical protein